MFVYRILAATTERSRLVKISITTVVTANDRNARRDRQTDRQTDKSTEKLNDVPRLCATGGKKLIKNVQTALGPCTRNASSFSKYM